MERSTGTKLAEDCRPMMVSRQSTRNQVPRFIIVIERVKIFFIEVINCIHLLRRLMLRHTISTQLNPACGADKFWKSDSIRFGGGGAIRG